MTHWVSKDGTVTVREISLDGVKMLRVTTSELKKAPVHSQGRNRAALVRMADGWWMGDYVNVLGVARHVALADLEERKEG